MDGYVTTWRTVGPPSPAGVLVAPNPTETYTQLWVTLRSPLLACLCSWLPPFLTAVPQHCPSVLSPSIVSHDCPPVLSPSSVPQPCPQHCPSTVSQPCPLALSPRSIPQHNSPNLSPSTVSQHLSSKTSPHHCPQYWPPGLSPSIVPHHCPLGVLPSTVSQHCSPALSPHSLIQVSLKGKSGPRILVSPPRLASSLRACLQVTEASAEQSRVPLIGPPITLLVTAWPEVTLIGHP